MKHGKNVFQNVWHELKIYRNELMNKVFVFLTLSCAFGYLSSQTDIDEQFKMHMKTGSKLFDDAKYDAALKEFQHARELSPQSLRPYGKIFWVYWRKHDGDAALRFLEEAPQVPADHKGYIRYLELFAAAYTLKSDYEKRDTYLKKIIKLDVEDTAVNLMVKGKAHCSLRNYEDALVCYQRAAETMDDSTEERLKGSIFWSLGHVNIQLKKYDDAITYFEEGLKHCSFAQGYDSLGTAYRKNGDLENARRCYAKAIEIDELLDNAWAGMGRCHRSEGNLERAKKCLQKCIRLNPHHGTSRKDIIDILIDMGNIDEAKEQINILQEQKGSIERWQKRITKCLERIEKL